MRVLILGAGHTGNAVAQTLVCESNDITVVDVNANRIAQLQRRYDLRGIIGDAASPAVLREAGIEDCDILIAVTASDETNLVASLLAAKLFNVPTRIARVRRNELSNYPSLLGSDGFHITSTIWPEQALTDALLRLIEFPEALQIVNLAEDLLYLVSLPIDETSGLSKVAQNVLQEKLDQIQAIKVALFRKGKLLDSNSSLETGDELLAIVNKPRIRELIHLVHPKENQNRNLVLAGDSYMALRIVSGMKDRFNCNVKILEESENIAHEVARHLPERTLLIRGSHLQEEDLINVDIDTCDLFISLSSQDDENIMGALLAKRLGAKRAIALIDNQTFADLVRETNIDVTISKTQVTLSELLQYVRHGDIIAVHSLRHGSAEILELIAHGSHGTSQVVGRAIREIKLPKQSNICAVVRNNEFLPVSPDFIVNSEDRIIVFSGDKRLLPEIEALFSVDVNFL